MQAVHVMSPNRTVPAVLTVAIHLLVLYVIAISTGIVPSPQTLKHLVLIDTPPEILKPLLPPPDVKPVDKRQLLDRTLLNQFTKEPVIITEPYPDIHVGDVVIDVEEPPEPQIIAAHVTASFEPPYPNASRLLGEQGVVQVRVTISPYGEVGDARIEKSSGFQRLDAAALKAVRQWRFASAMRGGQAIVGSAVVAVRFQLRS
jgi:protein TonB